MTPKQFWRDRMAVVQPYWWDEAADLIRDAEPLRARAKFNTGSISLTAAVALRALSVWAKPIIIVEVGTFIGVSTRSMSADQIFTCDVSNDCFDGGQHCRTFPYTTSTKMLRHLSAAEVSAELFFFDGLLSEEDVSLIEHIATDDAVFVFDDYNDSFKGVQNVAKLQPTLPAHVLMPAAGPIKADTTLAALIPEARL